MAVPRPQAKQNANKGGRDRESRVLHSSNVCPQVSDSLRYEVYTVRRKTNLYLCAKCVACDPPPACCTRVMCARSMRSLTL